MENLREKIKQIAKKKLAKSTEKVKQNLSTGAITKIGDDRYFDTTSVKDLFGSSNKSKELKRYLKYLGYDVDTNIEIVKKNKLRKKQVEYTPIPQVLYIDFWNWYIKDYFANHKEEIKEEYKQSLDTFKRLDKLKDFCKTNGKYPELLDFFKGIPNHQSIRDTIFPYLESLGEDEMSSFIYHLRSYKNPYELTMPFIQSNKVLRDLFNLKPEEVGKGELLFVFLYEGAEMMGGSKPYDIYINNDECNEFFELKAQHDGSIRLGKGKITNFDVYHKVRESLVQSLLNINLFKDCSYELISLVNHLKEIKIVDKWDSGEFSDIYLSKLKLFYYLANSEVYHFKTNKDINDFLIQYSYVRNPELLMEDLNNTAIEYFKNNGYIKCFIIFRKDKINFCEAKDLRYSTITQSGFKLIEKEYFNNKEISEEDSAWTLYKGQKTNSFEYCYDKLLTL